MLCVSVAYGWCVLALCISVVYLRCVFVSCIRVVFVSCIRAVNSCWVFCVVYSCVVFVLWFQLALMLCIDDVCQRCALVLCMSVAYWCRVSVLCI